MALEKVTVLAGKNKEPVECIRSRDSLDREGRPKPLVVFEHSWNIPPLPDYREFLEVLDEHVAVHALAKNGLNILADPPTTVRGFAEITLEYLAQLPGGQPRDVHFLGHSMGFSTAFETARMLGPSARSLIGVSPLLPGKHSLARFLFRFLGMSAGMLLGSTGPRGREYLLQSALSYSRRALIRPMQSAAMIGALARIRLGDQACATPTCLIRSTVDELIPYTSATAGEVRRVFSALTEREMSGRYDRHSLPVVFGRRAAEEVLAQYRAWGLL